MLLSIIVPTYNESDNVKVLCSKISEILLDKVEYEIIFVDDSTDNTPEILNDLSESDSKIRFLHRTKEKGLGTAVVRGFELAHGDVLTVMDADLQHPPEVLLSMIEQIKQGADIVIPSRFVPGGNDGGLRFHRKIVSGVARYIGKIALKSIRNISDPTSGFFMFRKQVIENIRLKPIGWKILIEILVRGNYKNVTEIPYRFQARNAGESKMSLKEQWNYLRHLTRLIIESPIDRRFYLFALIGMSGVLINMVIYNILVKYGISVTLSGSVSALCALLSNFYFNDRFTWYEVRTSSLFVRFGKYFLTSILGILINLGVLDLLYYDLSIHYLLSNLAGILVATVFNYTVNNFWTWKPRSARLIQYKKDTEMQIR